MTINQANRAIFELHLKRAYDDLFANDPSYAGVARIRSASGLAYKMALGLANGEANIEGEGIKRACKAVGIKHSRKAILQYLNTDS